ncbi:MAG: VOC family protein [Aestuariivirgaceae bacterium]|nr:VOC family protein [Aestuariivirgaceae bacterium]
MGGLHHVTAISGAAAENVLFYRNLLGMRLVKRTVNFDDPGTWHLYFGDDAGRPGSLMTFFPWANAARGLAGSGETVEVRLGVPKGSLGRIVERFGATRFADPDGLRLAVEETDAAIGITGVKLQVPQIEPTAAILTDVLGFTRESDTRFGSPGGHVELEAVPGGPRGRLGRGTVHHIAFRAQSDAAQQAMAERLFSQYGIATTEQKDRNYFRSIYFREPGGVLFEIATDEPGFAVDEPMETLGQTLKLPEFLEAHRAQIEAALPRFD